MTTDEKHQVNSWGFTSATWDANDGKTVACSWTKNKRELREWGFVVENNEELVPWTGPWDFVPNASLRAIEPRFLTDLVDKNAVGVYPRIENSIPQDLATILGTTGSGTTGFRTLYYRI